MSFLRTSQIEAAIVARRNVPTEVELDALQEADYLTLYDSETGLPVEPAETVAEWIEDEIRAQDEIEFEIRGSQDDTWIENDWSVAA